MRKGSTTFRNVQLLKWCREEGVTPYWNLLYGFPGETADDYAETVDHLRAIWHLDPPTACGPIRLDRFSPYHADPGDFGMTGVRPMAPFGYHYPVEPAELMDIAYYFEFDYDDGRRPEEHAREAIALANRWKASPQRGDLEVRVRGDGRLQVLDTRGDLARKPVRALLEGWKAAMYAACDAGLSLDRLRELPTLAGVADAEIEAFLARCVAHRLMITTGRSWLSVGVWATGHRARWPGAEPAPRATRTELTLVR